MGVRQFSSGLALLASGLAAGPALGHHDAEPLPITLNQAGGMRPLLDRGVEATSSLGLGSRYLQVRNHPQFGRVVAGDGSLLLSDLHGSYAPRDWLALRAALPFVLSKNAQTGTRADGLADPVVGLAARRRLSAQGVIGAALDTTLPLGDDQQGFGAGVFISRASSQAAMRVGERTTLSAGLGLSWAYSSIPAAAVDYGAAASIAVLSPLSVAVDVRAQTALSDGRASAITLYHQPRTAGDTVLIITPAVTARLFRDLAVTVAPSLPIGRERTFSYAIALSLDCHI